MAEQVNQRIEDMINELEQMRRLELYADEEIKEIARRRKEFEYHIQRRVKQKEDFVQYITYEMALLQDISLRRKKLKLSEKKKDIEYAIAKRVNKVFKQFIYRFQNDVEIYFEYIKFCQSVGFGYAISSIIGQLIQIHGDKPKVWQLASKWESKEQNNLENARSFLLKGLQRHPDSEALYLQLFDLELITYNFKTEGEEEKETQIKRADVVWRNGIKKISDVSYLFKVYDLCLNYEIQAPFVQDIKQEIWSRNNIGDVWSYVAKKELEGCHWEEIEQFVEQDYEYPKEVNYFIAVYEEALQKFPELYPTYMHGLLSVDESKCSPSQRIRVFKHGWMYGLNNGLLNNDMYTFGLDVLKLENEMSSDELMEIVDTALKTKPGLRSLWEEKILLSKSQEKKMLSILQDAMKVKSLKPDELLTLYILVLDNVKSNDTLMNLYKKFQNCENVVLLAIKPKLLKKMYELHGIKAARQLYEELIKTPPTQIEVHENMINIEMSQESPNIKNVRRCYECAVHFHGINNVDIWMKYVQFETKYNPEGAAAIYRRAVAVLKKELVDEFIKAQSLAKM